MEKFDICHLTCQLASLTSQTFPCLQWFTGLLKLEINSFASNIFLKNISYRYGLISEEIMYGQCWSEINFTLIYVKCNKVFVLYY